MQFITKKKFRFQPDRDAAVKFTRLNCLTKKHCQRIWFGAGVFFLMAVSVSLCYITGWQSGMESILVIEEELEKEDAGQWKKALIKEMECFPVKEDETGKETWGFENGYGEGRNYGGNRKHEGIDIMSSTSQSGYFAIQSVSDGIVEQLGWLELGGYRVGVRTDSGLYFYYAHLDSYAPGLQKGDKVHAGQLLGYMGDTGYGEEGTRGKFMVHLHFGIYYNEDGKERSLNPFYLLQYRDCGMIEKEE